MAFTINGNLVFIGSMWFINSSPNGLGKTLLGDDFKYLFKEISGDLSELVKQKRVYPYEYIDSLKSFLKIDYPACVNFLVL